MIWNQFIAADDPSVRHRNMTIDDAVRRPKWSLSSSPAFFSFFLRDVHVEYIAYQQRVDKQKPIGLGARIDKILGRRGDSEAYKRVTIVTCQRIAECLTLQQFWLALPFVHFQVKVKSTLIGRDFLSLLCLPQLPSTACCQ